MYTLLTTSSIHIWWLFGWSPCQFLIFDWIVKPKIFKLFLQDIHDIFLILYSKLQCDVVQDDGIFVFVDWLSILWVVTFLNFFAFFFHWEFLDFFLNLFFILLLDLFILTHDLLEAILPFKIGYFELFISFIFLH